MNFYRINRGLYKRLHKYFSYQSLKYLYRNEVKKKIYRLKCKPLSRSQKREIKDYYSKFGFKNICTDWHRLYTHMSGKFYKEYIPEDFFYNVVEPSLNMKVMFPALMDKNLLDKLFTDIKQPKTIIKNINGVFIDGDSGKFLKLELVLKKCLQFPKLVIKPSIDSGGGKDVNIITLNNKGITDLDGLTLEQLLRKYDKNFIIQELFIQHKQMSLLNPDSVNTIRFKTLYVNEKIVNLYSVVRIGSKGAKVDNTSQGGFFCKIDKNGILVEKGFYGSGIHTLKTETGIILKDFQIPNYFQIKSKVLELHKQIPHFKMISWDITIDENEEATLLEYNVLGQGFSEEFGPMFYEYMDEILSNCEVKLFSD